MRAGIFIIGVVILVLGLIIVMMYQPMVGAMEALVGGWAIASPDYREWNMYLNIGYLIALIGIIIMIPALIMKGKSESQNESDYICGYCKFVAKSERELHNHSLDCEAYKQEINKEKHNALDILKERYAKGDITKEEFEQMKEDLS